MTSTETMRNKNSIDMTKGPLVKNILLFTIPIVFTSILQLLYNSADLAVVGQFGSNPEISLSAIGTTAPITSFLVYLFIGLSHGANVIVAQNIGAGDSKKVSEAVHTSIILSVILGVVGGAFGFIFSEQFLMAMNCEGKLLSLSTTYLKIIFLGMPFNILYSFGAAILRANGDTKRPFIILSISGILNVLLNIILVTVFNLDILGVATATVFAQFISAIAIFVLLCKNNDDTKLSFKNFKIDGKQLKKIIAVGIPSGIQASAFCIPGIISRAYLIELGDVMSSATTIQWNVCDYISAITSSFGQTAVAFVAQNYGAKRYEYIKKITSTITKISVACTAIVCVVLGLFSTQIFSIFTNSKEVIKYANLSFLISEFFYVFWAISDVSLGANRGLSYKIPPTIVHLTINCILRILYFVFVFPLNKSYILLTVVYPVCWILSSIFQTLCYKQRLNKIIKQQKNLG